MQSRERDDANSTLPRPLTPLIGREREIAAIGDRLLADETRLLTLLGPGGSGKTRLAIAVARALERDAAAPAVFVDLAGERDPSAIVPAIARALGLRDDGDPAGAVAETLRDSAPVLVLDNLEQIPGAGRPIGALLAECPGVTILGTSRHPLEIAGEQRWPVEPLALPTGGDVDAVAASPAAALFLARARLARPDLALTAGNAATIAAICRRLDGLPLALELAAARLRALSPEALLARLSNRLDLLTGGASDLPTRQQTMRAAIAWSHDLLDPPLAALYAALGVFAGGFTLEAAEAVAATPDALDGLTALVDRSLARLAIDDGEPRYDLLEVIRDDALERLRASDSEAPVRARHTDFYVQLASEIEPELTGAGQGAALDRLDAERANFGEALAWLVASGEHERALGLAAALWRFWHARGPSAEGRRWLERTLAAAPDAPVALRAKARNGLGALAYLHGDFTAARTAFATAAEAWRETGDARGLGGSLNNLALVDQQLGRLNEADAGFVEALACFRASGDETRAAFVLDNLGALVLTMGDHARARDLHLDALGSHERLGNPQGVAAALHNLGVAEAALGDDAAAERHHQRELALLRDLGDLDSEANALNSLGHLASKRGDYAEADRRYEAAAARWREIGNDTGVALALHNLGLDAIRSGDLPRGAELLRESLKLRARIGRSIDYAHSLRAAASLARERGRPSEGARLLGAADALGGATDGDFDGDEATMLAAVLGPDAFAAARAEGAAMPADRAVGLALTVLDQAGSPTTAAPSPVMRLVEPPPAPEPDAAAHGLTARELDVLRLVAAGRSNAEIGAALFISPFTAKTHVANLLGKLGLATRAAAATWAARHNLA